MTGKEAQTTYTVIDNVSGEPIATGLSVAAAAAEVLTSDGQEYEIREATDKFGGFELWYRKQVANKPWTKSVIFSLETDRGAAESEIFNQVIQSEWPRHPSVMSDAQYAEMRAQLDSED